MRALDLLHRWTGGMIGLVLAILGLTGAILIHKEEWIALPHAHDPLRPDVASVAAATERLLALPGKAQAIVYASDRLGLHQLRYGKGAGLYADQDGAVVARWASQWGRPELWLFDLHHHLFSGDAGESVIGAAALCAILFVVSGSILWWRTRRTFRFRLWPKRLSRPAIIMHHRDLGVMAAPLLLLSALTGAMMVFQPVAALVVAPFTAPAQVKAALAPPKVLAGPLAARPNWTVMIATAHAQFPRAQFRILSLPRKPGDPVTIRLKQPEEWLPNGRTYAVFDGATGRLLAAKDGNAAPTGAWVFNGAYPLHAAKVGGFAWRLVMTCSGLALTLLGSLAVWSFWLRQLRALR